MKRLIPLLLTLTILLLLAGVGWAANYYIDSSSNVTGAITSGQFTANEYVVEATTGARAQLVGGCTASPMVITDIVGTPDASYRYAWTGQTSSAVFTPTAAPVANGLTTNNGTDPTTPWPTIAKVNGKTFADDDFCLFKCGCVWRGVGVTPTHSASAGHPTTYGNYGTGNLPVISGANIVTTWTDNGGGQWQATLATQPYVVYMDGVHGNLKANAAACAAEHDWFWVANVLYIYSPSDPNTRYVKPGVEAGAVVSVIDSTRTYQVFSGLDVRQGSGTNYNGTCIFLHTAAHQKVTSCKLSRSSAQAIQIYNDSQGHTITLNEIFDNGASAIAGPSATSDNGVSISYNNIHDNGWLNTLAAGKIAHAIYLKAINGYIGYNTVYNNGGAANATGQNGCGIVVLSGGGPATVEHNEVSYCLNSYGILTQANSTLQYNKSHDNLWAGFSTYATGTSTITVNLNYNLSYNNTYCGIELNPSSSNTTTVNAYNNTLYNNTNTELLFGVNGGPILLTAKNNILYASAGQYCFYAQISLGSSVLNNNIYYRADAGAPVYYGGNSHTWADWTGAGYEAQGINANPNIRTPVTDFHISNPAAGKGGDSSVWSGTASVVDYGGTSITNGAGTVIAPWMSIGAYQWQGAGGGLSLSPTGWNFPGWRQ